MTPDKPLQLLLMQGYAQAPGYNRFEYIRHTRASVILLRENGNEATVPFAKLTQAINFYQKNPELYDQGPAALRNCGITHITSPVYAMSHLADKKDFRQ